MDMLECQQCHKSLNKTEDENFIVKCKCTFFNRFRRTDTNKINNIGNDIKSYNSSFGIMNRVTTDLGTLYTYRIEDLFLFLNKFKHKSQKTAKALEKFIYHDKESLTDLEMNILYKLKAQSMRNIRERIGYLEAKLNFIDLLKGLDF